MFFYICPKDKKIQDIRENFFAYVHDTLIEKRAYAGNSAGKYASEWRSLFMSIEVELKLKIRDKAEITAALKQLGFTEEELVVETDTYYTAAHHDFAALDEALRIRTVENLHTKEQSAVITYKGAKLDQTSMTRKELETEIGDAETGREILEHIGFVPVPPVEKQRQYWKNGTITACVDNVKGLGDYLELEILADEEAQREEALEKLESILNQLGYCMQDTTRTSYLSMLMRRQQAKE